MYVDHRKVERKKVLWFIDSEEKPHPLSNHDMLPYAAVLTISEYISYYISKIMVVELGSNLGIKIIRSS